MKNRKSTTRSLHRRSRPSCLVGIRISSSSRHSSHAAESNDCFVTFYPLSEFNEDWNSVYSDMPAEVEFMMGYGPPLLEPFLRVRAGYYDTIFISRPHNMKILKPLLDAHPEWFESANIIYDAEAVFVSREITFRELSGAPISSEEANTLLQEEVELASAADSAVAVSEQDGDCFANMALRASMSSAIRSRRNRRRATSIKGTDSCSWAPSMKRRVQMAIP